MGYFADILAGAQIDSVLVDSEVTYIMLTNGTQVTIRGLVVVEPKYAKRSPQVLRFNSRKTSRYFW
jgi:hypothetical protein